MPTKNLINRIVTLAAPYAPLDGMNEKGLAIGVLVIQDGKVHQNTGKVPITTTSAIRMVLDKAATVDEAIELLKNYDMNSSGETGYHFQIADASGNTAVIEYINNEMHVLTKEEGGRNTPFVSNYRPQFYFRTTDVTGVITLPEGTDMVMPGDNVVMNVELIAPIAIETGTKFSIREGGHTVGAGNVTEIDA